MGMYFTCTPQHHIQWIISVTNHQQVMIFLSIFWNLCYLQICYIYILRKEFLQRFCSFFLADKNIMLVLRTNTTLSSSSVIDFFFLHSEHFPIIFQSNDSTIYVVSPFKDLNYLFATFKKLKSLCLFICHFLIYINI